MNKYEEEAVRLLKEAENASSEYATKRIQIAQVYAYLYAIQGAIQTGRG
jgi:hypothetical protein